MIACAVGILMLTSNFALAEGHGNGNGKGHGKHADDDQGEYYKDYNREAIHGWYDEHRSNLPPGLAKRDQLPPGLENSLYGAAHSHPVSKNGSSLVPRTLSGGYLRHLPIAHTC